MKGPLAAALSDPRGDVILPGPVGRIEAVYKRPAGERIPAALVVHPHPQYGGTMWNRVVSRIARALHASGVATLRFHFRGVGKSQGSFDQGRGERDDARAMIDILAEAHDTIAIAGFSFGAWVGLDVGRSDARLSHLVGVGLPVDPFDFSFIESCPKPKLVIHGERDKYGKVATVRALGERMIPPKEIVIVEGAGHFFEGRLDRVDRALRAWLYSSSFCPVRSAATSEERE